MNENLKNTLLHLTSSQLLVDWLGLCGFENFEDIEHINEKVMSDMENYIGTVCSLMCLDEREKYMDKNVFKVHPVHFKFPPSLKIRLLQAIKIMKKTTKKSSENITRSHLESLGCDLCSIDLHTVVIDNIKRIFSPINQTKPIKLDLYEPKIVDENLGKFGFFSCSIVESSGKVCGHIGRFHFSHDDSSTIDSESIISHMSIHFRRSNRWSRVSGDNSLSLECDNRSTSFISFPSADLADAKLCDDFTHDEVIKVAKSKFIDCHLERDIDFNLFEIMDDDFALTNRGCFLCYLCVATKAVESKIKFFFTSNRTVVNSNIIAHLRRHFQSIAPSTLGGLKPMMNRVNTNIFQKPKQQRRKEKIDKNQMKLEVISNKENIV